MHCDYKLENLSDLFCENAAAKKSDPFKEDIVVTQSKTMELYLNKKLADTRQIAINIDYLYPRKSINTIFQLCGLPQTAAHLNPEIFIWQIYQHMPYLEDNYPVIHSYIHHDESSLSLRRYQLSSIISTIFDSYMGYRGDWLECWQTGKIVTTRKGGNEKLSLGEHELWQSDLWRKLTVENEESTTFVRPSQVLHTNIDAVKHLLPEKISIFGISNLPADFIDFFATLRGKTQIDFYYLMPCLEYWGNINRRSARMDKFDNHLLESWAILGRDFFNMLLDNFDNDIGGDDLSFNAESLDKTTLLRALQSDILHNTPENDSNLKQFKNINSDNSIVINSCYSRMREIEVLHDHILDLLNTDHIEVDDIVVMAPDIEAYTPYIQAVFKHLTADNKQDRSAAMELTKGNNVYIPYTVADCSPLATSPEAETLLNILNIANSKIMAQDIFDIISSDPVSAKFKFTPDELMAMHDLILNANIAWGKNCEQRKQVTQTECNELNTWAFGFKRLFAGYAFDCEGLVDDKTLPLSLAGNQGILLGKLADICEQIFRYAKILSIDHSPKTWHETLLAIINDFFLISNNKNEQLTPIYNAVNSLFNNWQTAKLAEKIPFDVVQCALKNELNQPEKFNAGFFRGSLTFCRLLPMRNIPFKAVCLIGVNEGEFPRLDQKKGFDLSSEENRPGDRSQRKDDRYIFLETIMACREKLYLSYIGQSNNDNSTIPPSILISELLEYLELTAEIKAEDFITKHHLHGFNAEYFTGKSALFSFSTVNCEAAKALQKEAAKIDVFCPQPLAFQKNELNFTFDQWINFFIAPAKFFLNDRLKINLFNKNVETLRNCEPFELDHLEKYNLKNDYLNHQILNKSFSYEETQKATGDIPYGIWGEIILNEAGIATSSLADAVQSCGDRLDPTSMQHLKFHENSTIINLSGKFNNLYTNCQAFFRPSGIKTKDKLKAWLWHQLALESEININNTQLIGYSKEIERNCIDTETSHFNELMEIFLKGLHQPLPLFLRSSFLYIEQLEDTGDNEGSLKDASLKWDKSRADDYDYDLTDDANRICFGEIPPPLNPQYSDEFIAFAEKVYGHVIKEVL